MPTRLAVPVTLVLLLVLAACGDDGSGAAPPVGPTTTTTTTTAAPATTTSTTATAPPEAGDVLRLWPVVQILPPGSDAGPGCLPDREGALVYCGAAGGPEVDGEAVQTAEARFADGGGWTVVVELTPDGLTEFNDLAFLCFGGAVPAQCNGQIAIEVDGEVVSAPTVQTPSFEGSVQITGDFDQAEAVDLAERLDPGA